MVFTNDRTVNPFAVGYSTDAIYLPKEDMFVAVFMNQRSSLAEIIAAKLTAIAPDRPDTIKAITLSDSVLQSYTGVYMGDTVKRYIRISDNGLYYQREDSRIKQQMKPYAIDKFFFENTSVMGEIKRDNANRITELLIYNNRYPSSPAILKKIDLPLPAKE